MRINTINGKAIFEKDYIKKGFVTYKLSDKSIVDIPVKIIKSRQETIEKCKKLTIELLKRDNAYDFFQHLHKDFSRCRNYEIEEYLNDCSGYKNSHIISELCPFDGYSAEEFLIKY